MKIDPREADLKYKPFPSFVKWKQTELDLERWEKSVVELDSAKENNKENLTEALEIAKRAAAIESGAIEDLYDVDRGFTFTVAFQKAMWELKLEEKGSETISHIEAQLEGYDFVLDFATKQAPLIPAWIRELHQVICKNQESYQVYTEAGIQKKPLELGAYKNMPNHVLTQEGEIHAYCPVEFTPNEMTRLCDEIAGEVFQKSHPILQASYTHYALTVIHPFSDGNGRVARALASVFTYRSSSIPILIFSDDRPDYFKSL
ncbi:MAG: Fic family protein, partial [Balneola sp.]